MAGLPNCYRDDNRPRVRHGHPIELVLRDSETLESIGKQVEYCEIGWPQCYEIGEPIRMRTNADHIEP